MPRLGKNRSSDNELAGFWDIFTLDSEEEAEKAFTGGMYPAGNGNGDNNETDIPTVALPSNEGASEVRRTLQVSSPAMEGADVRDVQQRLLDHGYELPQYGVDGAYGNETAAAVRAFQQDNNLSVTGNVGPDTWDELQKGGGANMAVINELSPALQQFWTPLSTAEKWMYGLGGGAMLIGTGMAIYKSLNR